MSQQKSFLMKTTKRDHKYNHVLSKSEQSAVSSDMSNSVAVDNVPTAVNMRTGGYGLETKPFEDQCDARSSLHLQPSTINSLSPYPYDDINIEDGLSLGFGCTGRNARPDQSFVHLKTPLSRATTTSSSESTSTTRISNASGNLISGGKSKDKPNYVLSLESKSTLSSVAQQTLPQVSPMKSENEFIVSSLSPIPHSNSSRAISAASGSVDSNGGGSINDRSDSHSVLTPVRKNLNPSLVASSSPSLDARTGNQNISSDATWTYLQHESEKEKLTPLKHGPVCVDDFEDTNISSEDDDSTTASFWECQDKMNMTDGDLLNDKFNTGTLRLTKEGLEKHERKAFEESLLRKPGDSFEAWKKRLERQKFHHQKRQERQARLIGRTRPSKEVSNILSPPPAGDSVDTHRSKESTNKPKSVMKSLTSAILPNRLKSEEDVADISLAPLHIQADIKAPAVAKSKKLPNINIFNRGNISEKAKQILEKERQEAEAAQKHKFQKEKQDKDRIEKMRQRYLTQQRARERAQRERDLPISPDAETRSSIFVSMEGTELDTKGNLDSITASTAASSYRRKMLHTNNNTLSVCSQDLSTITSATPHGIPSCVVCKARTRTHIALPCMHFSYCQQCVSNKLSKGKMCLVCSKKDVTFAPVSV